MATITERNGAYLIMVSEGYGTDGRQRRKLMTWRPEPGMTKRKIKEELNIQAALFERRVRTGQVLDGHVTRLCEYGYIAPKPADTPNAYGRKPSEIYLTNPVVLENEGAGGAV